MKLNLNTVREVDIEEKKKKKSRKRDVLLLKLTENIVLAYKLMITCSKSLSRKHQGICYLVNG